MGSSNFPGGLMSMGAPVGLPPITGTYFHVCPGSATILNKNSRQIVGSSGNDGSSLDSPMDTLLTAYSACTDGAGDGIVLWSFGTSTAMTSSYLKAALTWAKSGITVIGVSAPVLFGNRARIANDSSQLALASLITVSGANNRFINLGITNYGTAAAALGGTIVTGYRNYFYNCQLVGAGSDSASQAAGANSLTLSSAQECAFVNCTIGIDTVAATGNNSNGVIQLASGVERCTFDGCIILSSYTGSSSTNGSVLFYGAGDAITRHVYFRNTIFANYKAGDITSSGAAAVFVGTAPNNGRAVVDANCMTAGFAKWVNSSSAGGVLVGSISSSATGAIGITATA